jgi:hypothetical protein
MKLKLKIFSFVQLICILLIQSCSPIFNGIYGFKKLKNLTEDEIIKTAVKFNIPLENCLVLDTNYKSLLKSFDTLTQAEAVKNHYQPLQMLYFNKDKKLISFHANCYAGGFPNLKWNRSNSFSVFPPQTVAPLDSLFGYSMILKYTQNLKPSGQNLREPMVNEYIVLVFWNRFLGRQSKRMISLLQENAALAKDKNLKIIYINNDNFFVQNLD